MKWTLCVGLSPGKEFKDFAIFDFYKSWEGCIGRAVRKEVRKVQWSPPPSGLQL